MNFPQQHAIAIVGVGAVLPDAPNAPAFWRNVCEGRYSITEVPAERWSAADYYDADPKAPDKTYSKIGGWVRDFELDWKRFRLPPKVAARMDASQQWALVAAAEALADYGFPDRPLDTERTGVILGTATGGQNHLDSHLRISLPEYRRLLESTEGYRALPLEQRDQIASEWRARIADAFAPITEDTMPGELANVVSGRVANVLDLRGPNFITDAACASSLAAVSAAAKMLVEHDCDAVLTGGVDHNMAASTFVKFCKVGALSARGSSPFGADADGFVMGEGGVVLLLRRLEDAERAGDKIYAVIRGIGVSSDGKGKGITAPNPVGQRLAIQRAWESAALDPATVSLIEAHGTSTAVGDRVELEALAEAFAAAPCGSIALGSVKGNVGHLKAAAGAAGLLKVAYALREQQLPPTLNAHTPNEAVDFDRTPYALNHQLRPWSRSEGVPRRAALSSFGFGGTNFHLVLEEHVAREGVASVHPQSDGSPPPPRGILAVGARSPAELARRVAELRTKLEGGWVPAVEAPAAEVLAAHERLVIDFRDRDDVAAKLARLAPLVPGARVGDGAWRALAAKGIFRGSGPPTGQLAFLFPGQGSQYLEMGRSLCGLDRAAADVFEEADAVMTPILGRSLSSFLFVGDLEGEARTQAELALIDTAVTQPAVICVDLAIHRLLGRYGFEPDRVMGHSLGEYAALVAAGALPLAHALEATAARGREMSAVDVVDKGRMAAVLAPFEVIERVLASIDGYVVMANINSDSQCVIGGASNAVEQAVARFEADGHRAVLLPVSHAFHTRIVAPASEPLRRVLDRLDLAAPRIPVVSNVTGEPYPADPTAIKDLLERQVASAVQWARGLRSLYAAGVRTFVEVGPKKALKGFVDDVLGADAAVVSLFTNHPKTGELASFNHALCGLYAAGHGVAHLSRSAPTVGQHPRSTEPPSTERRSSDSRHTERRSSDSRHTDSRHTDSRHTDSRHTDHDEGTAMTTNEVSRLLSQALAELARVAGTGAPEPTARPHDRRAAPSGSVVISGTGLGLPGAEQSIMAADNAQRLLRGEQRIDLVPERMRRAILDKQVTRLVKHADGSGSFELVADESEVIKLAARPGSFDLSEEYGVPADLVGALDLTTRLAMAAGLDALCEAKIPLVQSYRTTRSGKQLPDRWLLPECMRDETGVVFASAFPGLDSFAEELGRFHAHRSRVEQHAMLERVRQRTADRDAIDELDRQTERLRHELAADAYQFDRRFLFRVLAMGHSQFAQYVGARGPNTHVNTACASAGMALAVAEDWIRAGRCRRVVVLGADAVTSNNLFEWFGAGFQAAGAAATDDRVAEAALPFDRRRHGLVLGMGASALVVESEDAVRERGMRGIVELLGTEVSNSAFHGTRLDVDHVAASMDALVSTCERRFGLNRHTIASETLLLSHETYTPARGGSAAAEVTALRRTFGESANEVLITNTKGYTGHPLGVGVEAVAAVKMLEQGLVPAVANWREPDPDLGPLNLSRGGRFPGRYALVFSAGFGSQLAAALMRRIGGSISRVDNQLQYRAWLSDVTGHGSPELATDKHVLRVTAPGAPIRAPRPSSWVPGTGPTVRVEWFEPPHGRGPLRAPAERPERPGARTPTPAPTPTLTPAPTPTPARGRIAAEVIRVIAQKTGYPEDMLEPDLDLEADLGIDTVKQAETFAEIRRTFDIPPSEDLRLRDYPTLARVVEFVEHNRPDLRAADESTAARAALATPPAPAIPATPRALATSATPATPAPAATRATPAPAATPSAVGAAPMAPAVAPQVAAAVSGDDAIVAQVLRIVAAKTGYPEDMLELELDLEADLGIDTVKQAETFAEVRETFAIPRLTELRLRDYPTLGAVVQFVRDNIGASAPPAPSRRYRLEDAERVSRRVPVPCLRPTLEICKDTGIELGAGARVVVGADCGGVSDVLLGRLEARGVDCLAIDPDEEGQRLDARLDAWQLDGPTTGVYWLRALDSEADLFTLDRTEFEHESGRRVKALANVMRRLGRSVDGVGRFLVCGSRLGGLHGYGAEGASAPLGGAVTGFAKAYRREQPALLVKAVDFAPTDSAERIADALVAETLLDPGVVEVGYGLDHRIAIGLEAQPLAMSHPLVELDERTVFVVTGGAGGLGGAVVEDLAQASGGIFYLLDLAEAPRRDDADIALWRRDREALKRELIARARATDEVSGLRSTPQAIERQIAAVERSAAALAAIEAVEAAAGTATYLSVDLTDGVAVSDRVRAIGERHARVDVLVHAAGVEVSRRLCDKSPTEFDLVYDVKAAGLFNLLRAFGELPIGCCIVFSSVAGRFGNEGQTDYSAANDLLCKVTASLGRRGIRGIAIDWTAWADIGMASRGSMPTIMERAGIELLAPEVGVPTVRRELLYNPGGEVVVAGALGGLLSELDESGGLDSGRAQALLELREPRLSLIGQLGASRLHDGLEAEITLDPTTAPFLHDHQVEPGVPYLPGVMGIEALAQLAQVAAPALAVVAVEQVEFHSPFKFYRNEPRKLVLRARPMRSAAGGWLAHAELVSVVDALGASVPPKQRRHFTAIVRLEPVPRPEGPRVAVAWPSEGQGAIGREEIYRTFFHGPAYRVLDRAYVEADRAVGVLFDGLPPDSASPDVAWLTVPRLVELGLQTAGLWALGRGLPMGLPHAIGAVRFYASPLLGSGQGVRAVAVPIGDGTSFDVQVVDVDGRIYLELNGYRTVAFERARPPRGASARGLEQPGSLG